MMVDMDKQTSTVVDDISRRFVAEVVDIASKTL